jgi:hypothetical protein
MISAGGAASLDYTITFRSGTFNVTPVGPTVNPPPGLLNRARTTFTSSLYHNLLGRDPEPAGLRFWIKRLSAGTPAKRVVTAVWRSPEHRSLVRMNAARRVGLRSAEAAAFRAWSQTLTGAPESIRRILGAGALGEFLMAIGLFS